MKIKKDNKWIHFQDSLYWEDVIGLLEESKKKKLTLNKLIHELKEYVEENPDSPYVRGPF